MLRKTGKSWGISALKTWNFNEDAQIPLSLFTRANRADIKVFPTHRNKTGFLLNQSTFFVSSWMAVSTEPAGLRKALAACGPRVGAHQGEADLCDHPFHPQFGTVKQVLSSRKGLWKPPCSGEGQPERPLLSFQPAWGATINPAPDPGREAPAPDPAEARRLRSCWA